MTPGGTKIRLANHRPLILGASSRIGTGFHKLAQAGLWPGAVPLWQFRSGTGLPDPDVLLWDILGPDQPRIEHCRGLIVLAGVVNGDLGLNTALALAAIDLAVRTGCGPVLLTSSSAVYGHKSGPLPETAQCDPVSAYGRAKLAMERAVVARLESLGSLAPKTCILRVGNVAGADNLLERAAFGPVKLDQFADGQGPVRSYIGMQSLAQVMCGLIDVAHENADLPAVLNVAAPVPIPMSALLLAAGLDWDWTPAPVGALPRLTLDTGLLEGLGLITAGAGTPAELIRQARLIGWNSR